MYLFYPYYWGRKSNWLDRSQLQDVDPQFAEFLKAGAARVVLPVRPGFETAVAHFLDTGEIWDGADPPLLSSPLYVSIIQEIKERDLAPGVEVAQGDPWDVRLPTTLVRLRPDGSLPTWQKDRRAVGPGVSRWPSHRGTASTRRSASPGLATPGPDEFFVGPERPGQAVAGSPASGPRSRPSSPAAR